MVESDRKGIKETDDVKKSEGSSRKRRREQETELEVEAERKDSESTESLEEEEREPPTKKPRKKEEDMTARELVAHWNRTARVKKKSETLQGWLKKTQRKRDGQNRLLHRMKPETKSLREIRFCQRCQTFLVPVAPFHRLVRQICLELEGGGDLRWQSVALFALQSSTEAYMARIFRDANLCAIHRKVITVNRKDVWLAVEVRGHEHVGGRPQVSDVGTVNVTFKGIRLADPSEKKGVVRGKIINDFASEEDWCSVYREKVALDVEGAAQKGKGRGQGKGKGKEGTKQLRSVLRDAVHDISKAAIC